LNCVKYGVKKKYKENAMISKEKLDFAVNQVVVNCLKAKKGERTCVITDNQTKHIGQAIADKFREVAGDSTMFVMEDFGNRPEDGSSPLKFPDKIKDCLSKADISVYAAQIRNGEMKSFRKPMIDVVIDSKRIRHGHMVAIEDKIMEDGMAVDYGEIVKVTKRVYDILSKAEKVHVTTTKGTDFVATLNKDWKWGIDDGQIKPGTFGNLPAGEVFTTPQALDGKVVVDGILGDYMMEKFGLVGSTPIYMDIKNGYVQELSCANKEIEAELNKYVKKVENSNRVGELGIGTNIGLTKLIGNLLQDEKFPGVHIALGHPFPDMTGADWNCEVHLDMVILKTTIEVDGKLIMKDGKFLI